MKELETTVVMSQSSKIKAMKDGGLEISGVLNIEHLAESLSDEDAKLLVAFLNLKEGRIQVEQAKQARSSKALAALRANLTKYPESGN